MKELLQRLAGYNAWANQRLAVTTVVMAESTLNQPVIGSFPSVRSTILHMLDAESIWWQRLHSIDPVKRPGDGFAGVTTDALNMLAEQNNKWKLWVEQAGIDAIEENFGYKNLKGEFFTQPLHEVLVHVFNHGTYHRGQWVNQLRECGVIHIPSTDYIEFCRRKNT